MRVIARRRATAPGGAAPRTSRPAGPSAATRIPGIEGLRAVAAGAILAYHVWITSGPAAAPVSLGPVSRHVLPHLALGVTLFFALSAFLLYRPFAARIVRGEALPGFRAYARNRALRILPAYWVALVVSGFVLRTVRLPVDGQLGVGGFQEDLALFPMSALFLHNFAPRFALGGIDTVWSLVVEVCFYATLPLLAALAATLARHAGTRPGRRFGAVVPAVVVLLVGLTGKALAFALVTTDRYPSGWGGNWQSVVERSAWAQADLFTYGLLVAVLSVEVGDGVLRLPSWWRAAARAVGSAVVAVTAATMPNAITQRGELAHFAYESLMALGLGILLATVVVPSPEREARPSTVLRVLEARPIVALGLVSYSLFLWHVPLISWMRLHDLTLPGRSGFAANLGILTTLSVAVAALGYVLVERPALARKRSQRAPTP